MRGKSTKTIRVGVVGVNRGLAFASDAASLRALKLVAICDTWEERLAIAGRKLGVTTYPDFDEFLAHDMDAVILANYFHEHAPLAIRALEAGMHVMSETAACITMAEGVALVNAVEKSGRIYQFAENYPYSLWNQEMRRLYQSGKLGTFMYGEGEYVHLESPSFWNKISPSVDHWRNWLPATYYCSHALGPIMYITDTRPVSVNAFVIPYPADDPVRRESAKRHDAASMIALRMDNDAVVKLLQIHLSGHNVWVRVHGTQGQVENLRTNQWQVRLRREAAFRRRGEPAEQIYLPEFPHHHEQAMATAHAGGDFFMNYEFAEAIRKNEQPFLDVYRGVSMASVGILGYRSGLAGSVPLEVPDFRKKSIRRKFADDHWNPDPKQRKKGDPWPSVQGNVKVTPEALDRARRDWKDSANPVMYG